MSDENLVDTYEYLWEQTLAEFIGTFFLISTALVVSSQRTRLADGVAALSIGITLAVMVYWGVELTGASYNPAINIGFVMTNRISWVQFTTYTIAQLLAGIAAFGYWRAVLYSKFNNEL